MRHRTLTTGKILRSGYLGNHCHGNQKTFAWLISHLRSNGFLKGRTLVRKETVTLDFCYHGNHHVVIATKNVPLWGMICERESVHIHFFLSNSYTLVFCCVSEATPLTRPSERVKALVCTYKEKKTLIITKKSPPSLFSCPPVLFFLGIPHPYFQPSQTFIFWFHMHSSAILL